MPKNDAIKKTRACMLNQNFKRLFAAFLAVIFLIIAAIFIISGSMNDLHINDNRTQTEKTIYEISSSFERVFKKIRDTSSALYAYGAETLFSEIDGNPVQCIQTLDEKTRILPYISGATLIKKTGDKIVGVSTVDGLNANAASEILSCQYDEILSLFDNSDYQYELLPMTKPVSSSMYRRMDDFCYVQRMISSTDGKTLGLYIVSFNKIELRDYLGISSLSAKQSFFLLNYRNQIILRTGDYYSPPEVSFQKILPGYNSGFQDEYHEEIIELYGGYESLMPYKTAIYTGYIRNIWNEYSSRIYLLVFIGLIGFAMLTYLILTTFFQNRAIKNVSNLLENKEKSILNKMMTEDSDSLEGMISKEIVYAHLLKKQNDDQIYLMKRKMLLDLFTSNKPLDVAGELKQFERLGINMKNQNFAVCVFECKDVFDNCPASGTVEQEYNLLHFVIENIFREFGECYCVIRDSTIICLYLSTAEFSDDHFKSYILTTLTVCKSEFNYSLICGAGNISRGIEDISQSYYRAECSLEYAQHEKKSFCDYTQVDKYSENRADYSKSIEDRYCFINLVKAEDFEGARLMLKKITDNMTTDPNLSGEFLRLQVYEMLKAVVNNVSTGASLAEDVRHSLKEDVNGMFHCRSNSELSLKTLEIFDRCISFVLDNTGSRDKFLDSVFRIVESDYGNSDMSVNYIAERTKINSRTLSAKFIKKTGKGLLEYIHSVRIEEAKKLLVSGKSVQDVSQLVGYENPNTFIRVFKRYCDMTPGHYQEIYKK